MFAGSDYSEWPTDFQSLHRMCKRGVVKNDLRVFLSEQF